MQPLPVAALGDARSRRLPRLRRRLLLVAVIVGFALPSRRSGGGERRSLGHDKQRELISLSVGGWVGTGEQATRREAEEETEAQAQAQAERQGKGREKLVLNVYPSTDDPSVWPAFKLTLPARPPTADTKSSPTCQYHLSFNRLAKRISDLAVVATAYNAAPRPSASVLHFRLIFVRLCPLHSSMNARVGPGPMSGRTSYAHTPASILATRRVNSTEMTYSHHNIILNTPSCTSSHISRVTLPLHRLRCAAACPPTARSTSYSEQIETISQGEEMRQQDQPTLSSAPSSTTSLGRTLHSQALLQSSPQLPLPPRSSWSTSLSSWLIRALRSVVTMVAIISAASSITGASAGQPNNVTSLAGTWSSGSGHVLTGLVSLPTRSILKWIVCFLRIEACSGASRICVLDLN